MSVVEGLKYVRAIGLTIEMDCPVQESNDMLEEWMRAVLPKAVAYARSLVEPKGDAEDVVHEVMCRLLSHQEYDMVRHGDKLLFRSITNACINRWKRCRPHVSLDGSFSDDGAALKNRLPAGGCDPATRVAQDELFNLMGKALRQLPPAQRVSVELKAMGYSLKDIAEMCDVSVSNAGVLVHRGRKALMTLMAPLKAEGVME